MQRTWSVASLAAVGLIGLGTARAQTDSKSTGDAGPALPPAPVVSVSPSAPQPKPATPPLPTPAPLPTLHTGSTTALPATATRPLSVNPRPATLSPPTTVRTTNFADPPVTVIPNPPKPIPVPAAPTAAPSAIPLLPMPGTVIGSVPGTVVGNAPAAGPAASPAPGPVLPTPAKVEEKKVDPDDFTPKFKFKPGDNNLLQMETANGLFKFYVGGRLQIDAVWVRAHDDVQAPRAAGGVGDLRDGVNFRRARFDFGGTFYKNIDFLMEWDFINTTNVERIGDPLAVNTPVPTDMWVTFKEVPYLGNVRIGNQKPPISFEHMTSSRFLNFMERSLTFDAFIENQNNGFEPGIAAFDTMFDERATWSVGVFKNTRSIFGWNMGDGEYDVTGRVTCLPIYENEGETLVHLGLGASHRDFDDDFDRMRARTLVRNGPATLHNIVAEVQVLGDSRDQIVPEFVVVYGPLTIQAEYYSVWAHEATTPVTGPGPKTNHGTVRFQGAYGEILYFLTGEHRHYNRKIAAFGRVTPHDSVRGFGGGDEDCDCFEDTGIGAWQIAARYSWLDLNDKGINGGICQDVTIGLNWFINPYMKWQWNYSMLYREAANPVRDGWIYGFGTRIAIDF